MYYLKPTDPDKLKGVLYKITKGQKELINKDFDFKKEPSTLVKGAIICQWLTEGQTLELLETDDALPSKYEFYLWLEEEKDLAMLYEKAQHRRAMSMIETQYKRLSSAEEVDDDKLQKTMAMLNEIRKLIKNKDASVHTVINNRVFVPPIMEEWYDDSYDMIL